jgi:hypothetical protein
MRLPDDNYNFSPYTPPRSPAPVFSPYQPPLYVPPSPYGGELDTGTEYVSRVGPSVSIQPRADLLPGIPAGSLFSSRSYGYAPAYRGRVPYQRGFSVDRQEGLRRRRRRGLFNG